MRLVQFEPSHLTGARAHPKQAHYQHVLDAGCRFPGTAWSMLDENDDLVCVGGFVPMDAVIGAWALFTTSITPPRFLAIYRIMFQKLERLVADDTPVMIHVDPNYPEATRMATALGFRCDGEERFGDGRTMIRMATNV